MPHLQVMTRHYRQLVKSVAMRGAWGTALHLMKFPFITLNERRQLADRVKVQSAFDEAHGLDTSGIIRLSSFQIDNPHWVHGVRYAPTSPQGFHAALALLGDIIGDYSKFTFVDVGSGKGPVLLYAADLNFKAVIGIEFVKELHDIAVANISRYPSARGRATSICADATTFEMPEAPVVVYFNYPFSSKDLMRSAIDNIAKSKSAPKYIVAVNYPYDPATVTQSSLRLISSVTNHRTNYAFEVL